ncbi:unnamed protein product, partial [Rotaria magnacalcarata]
YQDQALLTWHGSEDEFRTLFNTGTDTEHTENLVTMSIGSTVHFHDLEIGHNSKGVLENVDQQAELKKQRDRQRHNTLFLPCPHFNDQETLATYKQRLKVWWKKHYGNEPQTKHIQIKWIESTSKNLTNSDILVNKRPPIRLLTLPKNEKQ